MDSSLSSSSPAPDSATSFEQGVRSLIWESEANLQAIDAEIAHLHSLIATQYRRREIELNEIASLRAKIAPIRKLPVELLAEIFVLSLETDSSQFCVSHVSHYWRRVAHSTPSLWQRLALQPPDELTQDYLDVTKAWIDHSSPLPLSLRIRPSGYNSHTTSLMSVLLSAAHRWKKLETTPEVIDYFPSVPTDAFASLEEVRFERSYPHTPPTPHLQIRAFSIAPQLRSFSNLDVGGDHFATYHMPWKQLAELQLCDMASTCRSILRACENVETVRVEAQDVADMVALSSQTLPFLKTLHVSFEAANVAATFLDSLALPTLRTLTIDIWFAHWFPGTFTRFQLRSPNIRTLTLKRAALTSAELIDVLRRAPSLNHLALLECPEAVDDQLFDALQVGFNFPPLVPRLVALAINPTDDNVFSSGAVCRMVRSRWWSDDQSSALAMQPPVARLEKLQISRCFITHYGLRYDLLDCRDQGFDLQS
ncbi:F-box domain-containing protein [Mycena venus]|uniref:F-box domain-containing protein n=1 Tax=Mycena venus TaxID=2733690 RepID=A0A8H6XBG0_9AGAR|nr:F-box domain-containing protein [Mycena venus]